MRHSRALILFTKPADPGRVKTRLIGELSAEQAAELHGAFRDDLLDRLEGGAFDLSIAWALDSGAPTPPAGRVPGFEQRGEDLGKRLFNGLSAASSTHRCVAAVGSDHPLLSRARVEEAFSKLEEGADVVLGPADDGGYYLIGVRRERLAAELFEGVAWSTAAVRKQTLERCATLGLRTELLAMASDVDTPSDLTRLVRALADQPGLLCPRTRGLLEAWGRLVPA